MIIIICLSELFSLPDVFLHYCLMCRVEGDQVTKVSGYSAQ